MQFVLDAFALCQRVGDFLVEQFAITPAQPVDRHPQRALAHAQFRGGGGVGNLLAVRREKIFQPLEFGNFSGALEFRAQPRHGLLQQRQGPAALIVAVGGNFRRGNFRLEFSFRQFCVEGDGGLKAAAFLRVGAVPFIRQEPLERNEQKGAETSALLLHRTEKIFFEQPREERLRQVLGVLPRAAAAPDVGVEREPIRPAEFFERGRGLRGLRVAGREHERPVCGGKNRVARNVKRRLG